MTKHSIPNKLCTTMVGLVLLVGCWKKAAPARPTPDLSYLPGDVFFVAYADTIALKRSPLYRDWDASASAGSEHFIEAKTFLRRLGIDPEKDVDGVMLACRPRGEGGEWSALLRGRFDLPKMQKGLAEPSSRMAAEPYGKWTIYSLAVVPEVGDVSLTPVDEGTIALGKADSLRAILDTRDKGKASLAGNPLMKKMMPGLPAEAQIWALLDGQALRRVSGSGFGVGPGGIRAGGLESVVSASLAATLEQDMALDLLIGSDSPIRARSLADTLKGIVGFARLGSGASHPELDKVMDALRVSHEGDQVHVRLKMTAEMVKKLESEMERTAEPAAGSGR
ncbi:MAG TPA: hypothetical protein VFW45_13085 [Candidatus Polarisedimenticolia bacterium]|nr:hypothetical protein [Candidatus Polarisedimenticolia bacterium]